MAFSVNIYKEPVCPVIILKDEDGNCEAVIYALGALLNSFSMTTPVGKLNVIDGFASPADAATGITNAFKSAKLSPFVCRLNKGSYSFEGHHYRVNKFYLGGEAIHGLLYDAMFEVADYIEGDEKASVRLCYKYDKSNEGFPFSYTMEIIYTLHKANQLSITTTVKNTGDGNMPLSDGWHPYFSLGKTVNDLAVQFNSTEMVEFDERLLPTGKVLPYPAFETPQAFEDTTLDNCFLLKDFDTPACILKDKKTSIQLAIIPDASYPYLQVYTPPHRKSIAIENLSSPPDSFNNGISLIVAKPGETCSFTTAYQLAAI